VATFGYKSKCITPLLDSTQNARLVCISYLPALTQSVWGRSSAGRAHDWQSSAYRFANHQQLNGLQPARILGHFPFCYIRLIQCNMQCRFSPATIWPQRTTATVGVRADSAGDSANSEGGTKRKDRDWRGKWRQL